MKVVLSPTAKFSLIEIIENLKVRWTQKEIDTLKSDSKVQNSYFRQNYSTSKSRVFSKY